MNPRKGIQDYLIHRSTCSRDNFNSESAFIILLHIHTSIYHNSPTALNKLVMNRLLSSDNIIDKQIVNLGTLNDGNHSNGSFGYFSFNPGLLFRKSIMFFCKGTTTFIPP